MDHYDYQQAYHSEYSQPQQYQQYQQHPYDPSNFGTSTPASQRSTPSPQQQQQRQSYTPSSRPSSYMSNSQNNSGAFIGCRPIEDSAVSSRGLFSSKKSGGSGSKLEKWNNRLQRWNAKLESWNGAFAVLGGDFEGLGGGDYTSYGGTEEYYVADDSAAYAGDGGQQQQADYAAQQQGQPLHQGTSWNDPSQYSMFQPQAQPGSGGTPMTATNAAGQTGNLGFGFAPVISQNPYALPSVQPVSMYNGFKI